MFFVFQEFWFLMKIIQIIDTLAVLLIEKIALLKQNLILILFCCVVLARELDQTVPFTGLK